MNAIINFSEAHEEAQRLSRVLRRDVEAKTVECPCQYSKECFVCGGEGLYYELIFSFCSHVVGDGEESECDLNFCREQEHARAEMALEETFARVGAPVKSCRERASEEAA